jgi:hypothetical protein
MAMLVVLAFAVAVAAAVAVAVVLAVAAVVVVALASRDTGPMAALTRSWPKRSWRGPGWRVLFLF